MVIPSRVPALLYRIVFALVAALGLSRLTHLDKGEFDASAFLYFTGLTNLACLVWAIVLVAATIGDLGRLGAHGTTNPSPRFAGGLLFSITITMVLYLTLLAATAAHPFTLTDDLIHIFVPLLMIGEWLFFTPKGRQRRYDPLLWLLPLFVYVTGVLVISAVGGRFNGNRYPYPIMNIDRIGWGGFGLMLLVGIFALLAMGYAIYFIDRALGRRARLATASV